MARAFNATETFELKGDGEYTFSIDIEIIDKIEDQFDDGFESIMLKIGSGKLRLGKLTRLFHGLLVREHPDISLDDVGGLAFAHGKSLMAAMERLFVKAWPEAETKGKNPPKARRGTGANSSSNGARMASRQVSSGGKPRERLHLS